MLQATETLIFDVEIKSARLVLRAIDHPFRKKVLFLLDRKGPLTVTQIWTTLRSEQSVCSAQLGILRDAGIIKATRDGKNTLYSVNIGRLQKINEFAELLNKTRY